MKQDSPATVVPSLFEMFVGFTLMSLQGIGGVLVFARRDIVERRRWMTSEEFNEAFAFSQLMPGPNIVNFAVMYGQRHYGPLGAVLAFLGMLGPVTALIMVIAVFYFRFGEVDVVRRILNGTAVVAGGLILSAVLKMSMPVIKRPSLRAAVIIVGIFLAIGIFRLPLPLVLAVALPASLILTWISASRGWLR